MITSLIQRRLGRSTTVYATSDLSGRVAFYWYIDGAYVGSSAGGSRTFLMAPGEQVRIDVRDSNDAAFDPVANAPLGFPARRTLLWVPRGGPDTAHYSIRQSESGGPFVEIGTVAAEATRWRYRFLTPRLNDLTSYTWWIVPIAESGNAYDPLIIGPELIVRTPDAPAFDVTFDAGTTRVTFSEAA